MSIRLMPGASAGITVRDDGGVVLASPELEFGMFSGPASYATGGFTIDLSARFTSLSRVLLIKQVDALVGAQRWHMFPVVTINDPAPGVFRVLVRGSLADRGTLADASAQNPPGGVTLAVASGQLVVAEATHTHGSGGLSVPSAAVANAGANPTAGLGTLGESHGHSGLAGATAAGAAHQHAMNTLYQHGHAVTQTPTAVVMAEFGAGFDFSGQMWAYLAVGN